MVSMKKMKILIDKQNNEIVEKWEHQSRNNDKKLKMIKRLNPRLHTVNFHTFEIFTNFFDYR